ncbi:hypothetical protein OURE66S_04346 [Oligella ureolytica]
MSRLQELYNSKVAANLTEEFKVQQLDGSASHF